MPHTRQTHTWQTRLIALPLIAALSALTIACTSSASEAGTPAPLEPTAPTATATPAAASPRLTATAAATPASTAEPTPTPAPTPPAGSPRITGSTEHSGSLYTVNQLRDPAPPGSLQAGPGNRLVAIDVTQERIAPRLDAFSPYYFAVQDAGGNVYFPNGGESALEPAFSAGELAPGEQTRGWITFELPQGAKVLAVLAEPNPQGGTVVIAALD